MATRQCIEAGLSADTRPLKKDLKESMTMTMASAMNPPSKSKRTRMPSQFERDVRAAPKEHVAEMKVRLERAYAASGASCEKLKRAIEHLDSEPGWFLNENGIYRDIITDGLRDLASGGGLKPD